MRKNKSSNILNFPSNVSDAEREIEAVLFASSEPLSVEDIKTKISKNSDVKKILIKLQEFYSKRGINLICISNKWSFRTSENLSSLI